MCGIGAAIREPRGEAAAALEAMRLAMRHRGPDDSGLELFDGARYQVGLCATRLAVQDTSAAGHQPMTSTRTGNAIAFNGEIYNVAELRDELASRGHEFAGGSDTEAVLAAFDEWGSDCFRRLKGMFAIAIWEQAARRLVLARDHLGIKPLYVWAEGGDLLVASEVRALLATGRVPRRLSQTGFASFLAYGSVQEPATIIEGISALPPGSIGHFEPGGSLRVESYWTLEDAIGANGHGAPSTPGDLRHTLEQAVARHLVSDVPLGVFLSGGIDSSALVALTAGALGEPPRTVSLVFDEARFSEAPYIQQVVDRYRTEHTQLELAASDVLGDLDAALLAMDQPSVDGLNTYVISKLARESGLTVVLSGLGGDELFAGYDTFRLVPALNRVRELVPAAAGGPPAWMAENVFPRRDRGERLARWLRRDTPHQSPWALRRELFPARDRAALTRGPASQVYEPTFDRRLDGPNAISALELSSYMRNTLLRDSDAMSMAHSLELRVPLLDRDLVEHVLRIPGEEKTGPPPKRLLIEALGDALPAGVVSRPKMGFTLPFEQWLRAEMRLPVERALTDRHFGAGAADLLSPAAVGSVWSRFVRGRINYLRPWSLYVLKVWADRHLDGPAS